MQHLDMGALGAGLGMDAEEARAHAAHVWEFLDELARSDPEAYRAFVLKQKQEAAAAREKAQRFLPKPGLALHTAVTHNLSTAADCRHADARELFVNLCHSEQVPPPQLQGRAEHVPAGPEVPLSEIAIPLSVGKIVRQQQEADEEAADVVLTAAQTGGGGGESVYYTCDVVVSPVTFERCQADMGFRAHVIELALQFVEEDHRLKLHRRYHVLQDSNYKGTAPRAHATLEALRQRQQQQVEQQEQEQRQQSASKASAGLILGAAGGGDADDARLDTKSLRIVHGRDADDDRTGSQPDAAGPHASSKKLIQELLQTPQCTFEVVDAGTVAVRVELPLHNSVADVELHISSTCVKLRSDVYELEQALPHDIDETRATAKFIKKKHLLKIKAPRRRIS